MSQHLITAKRTFMQGLSLLQRAPASPYLNHVAKWTAISFGTTTFLITARFLYQKHFNPLHIIWDLDATILASHLLGSKADDFDTNEFPDYFDQVDDDFPYENWDTPNTRTWFRPFAKTVLKILSFFTKQHVFTSAQESYTNNILNHLNKCNLNVFDKVLHRDLYKKGYLRKHGKNICEIIGYNDENGGDHDHDHDDGKENPLIKRTLLFDDQKRYLKPWPNNGILVKPYGDVEEGKNDREMLRFFGIILLSHFVNDVTTVTKFFGLNSWNSE